MNSLRTPELKSAFDQVEYSRVQLGEAFLHLEKKLYQGFERADRLVYRAQTPVRLAQRHPWMSLAAFFALGLWVGARQSAGASLTKA